MGKKGKSKTTRAGAAREKRRGVAAAEFAITVPVLVLLFVIALDYARIFYVSITLWNCAGRGD